LNCTSDYISPTLNNTEPVTVQPDNPIVFTIDIEFDESPQENGYFLERVSNLTLEGVSKILPGAFLYATDYSQKFNLEKGDLYSFIFFDIQNNGLQSGGGT
jgi:hypothetical protein